MYFESTQEILAAIIFWGIFADFIPGQSDTDHKGSKWLMFIFSQIVFISLWYFWAMKNEIWSPRVRAVLWEPGIFLEVNNSIHPPPSPSTQSLLSSLYSYTSHCFQECWLSLSLMFALRIPWHFGEIIPQVVLISTLEKRWLAFYP